jgi:hypothetical protein
LPEHNDLFKVLNFLELLALLEKRGYLSAEDLWEPFGDWILSYLQASSVEISDLRASYDPNSYLNLTTLGRRLEDVENKRNERYQPKSEESLKKFWEVEARLGAQQTEFKRKVPAKRGKMKKTPKQRRSTR